MYVVIMIRLWKKNTGATEKFAPRTTLVKEAHLSGPFTSLKAAQRAAMTALGTHTCLGAEVWTAKQIREEEAKGYARIGSDRYDTMKAALRLIEGGEEAAV